MTDRGATAISSGAVRVASSRTTATLAVGALVAIGAAAVSSLVVPWLAIVAVGAGAGYSLSGSV